MSESIIKMKGAEIEVKEIERKRNLENETKTWKWDFLYLIMHCLEMNFL